MHIISLQVIVVKFLIYFSVGTDLIRDSFIVYKGPSVIGVFLVFGFFSLEGLFPFSSEFAVLSAFGFFYISLIPAALGLGLVLSPSTAASVLSLRYLCSLSGSGFFFFHLVSFP